MQIESKKLLVLISEALESHNILLKMNRDHLVETDGLDNSKHLVKIEVDLITLEELRLGVRHNLNGFDHD